MTRIVRFEEIDGQLIFRVPADIAARMKFAAGDSAMLTDGDKGLTVERLDERKRRQLEVAMQVIEEHDEALAALAK